MSDLRPIRHTSIATLHGMIFTCDYGQDVGNLHVIDFIIHREGLDKLRHLPRAECPRSLHHSPADWSHP